MMRASFKALLLGAAIGGAAHARRERRPSSPSWSFRGCRTSRCSPRRRKAFSPNAISRSTSRSRRTRRSCATGSPKAATRSCTARSTMRSRWRKSPRPTSRLSAAATTAGIELIVQPDIGSVADLRGKTVIVDAPNTAYALQLYDVAGAAGPEEGRLRGEGRSARRSAGPRRSARTRPSRPRC